MNNIHKTTSAHACCGESINITIIRHEILQFQIDNDLFSMMMFVGIMHTCILFSVLFELTFCTESVKQCRNSIVSPFIKGIKVSSLYAFESISARTVYECSELCQRRKICKSATFLAKEQKCQLNAVKKANAATIHDTSSEYIENAAFESVSILNM